MMGSVSRRPVFLMLMGAALLAVPACSTQEIGPGPVTYVGNAAGPDNGELLVVFPSPSETYEEQQARAASGGYTASYTLYLDGKQLVWEVDGRLQPALLGEGAQASAGFLPSGPHQFAIVGAKGGPTVFVGDVEIVPGFLTRLYLFGRLRALEGRFVSHPAEPPPGMLHVSVINLVRDGRSVEVVSCGNADDCTSVSPALALGRHFGADFPAADGQPYALADGRRIGWRQAPTAAVPSPPVQQLTWEMMETATRAFVPPFPPATFAVAPLYLSPQGDPLSTF
jgi:hypothetical protein